MVEVEEALVLYVDLEVVIESCDLEVVIESCHSLIF